MKILNIVFFTIAMSPGIAFANLSSAAMSYLSSFPWYLILLGTILNAGFWVLVLCKCDEPESTVPDGTKKIFLILAMLSMALWAQIFVGMIDA